MRERASVLGCEIDRLTMSQTVARCDELISERRCAQHVAINAAKLVAMHDDAELRDAIRACEVVNADGQAIVWASRLLGDPLPERVAGIDLMHGLLQLAEDEGYRVYIVGARRQVLERAVARLERRYPRLVLAGFRDGYFDVSEDAAVAEQVSDARPDLLLVAMSSPRKERWLGDHRLTMRVPLVMGVGGSIDVVAGITRRAPRVLQRLGLEWLFRLGQEPRRMLRRYATTNTRFLLLLARALLARRLGGSRQALGA